MPQDNNSTFSGSAPQNRSTHAPAPSAGRGGTPPRAVPPPYRPLAAGSASAQRPAPSAARPAPYATRPTAGTQAAPPRSASYAARPAAGTPPRPSYDRSTGSHPAPRQSPPVPYHTSGIRQPPPAPRGMPPDPPEPPDPPRRKRRRMGPFGALLYVLIVLGLSVLFACVGWAAAGDVLALNKAPAEAVVVIAEGDNIGDVANALKKQGIIQYKTLFRIFSGVTHASDDITPGTYQLNTDMDYRAIIKSISISSRNRASVTVTITEGMTLKQIFRLLEENGVSTVAKLNDAAANHAFKYSFLQEIPLGSETRLEGYLFPDTYDFYMGGDPVQILNKLLLRFDEKFTQEMRGEAEKLGYSVADIVNIASMIEKETDGEDQAVISAVIYNRLERATSETAGYLNIDATIAYITGEKVTDTNYPTPYNTYTNKGLPPGPIANPGMTAIYAALHPDGNSRKLYYYALGDDGAHHFFKTHRQQKDFIATQELYNG